MSVLTRIKNNQITDSTILANTKIVPGSIVGSLFNTNLTMTSDVTITGNLTVQGSSTYLTVASTNTYVNDPLIILNNAFSGTNTYDIGLLFNRGNQTTTALIWNEANDEFRLIYTTDDGTGYGAINNSGYGNIRVGNLAVQYDAGLRNITATGDADITGNIIAAKLTLSGDLAVNGGDLTSNAGTFNLLTGSSVLNFATSATAAQIGATTGILTLNNPTVVGSQTTQNLYNTVATTLNFAGAATTLTLGATSGTASLRNANVWLPNATSIDGAQTTVNLLTQNATTVSAFTSATTANIGAGSGTLTINNPTVVGQQATQNLYNTVALAMNFAGAATAVTVGATSGTLNLRNANIYLPNATTLYSGQATLAIADENVTTLNIGGAATALTLGATTGTLTLRNATVTTPGQIISTRGGSATTGDGQIYLNGSTSNRIDWNTNGTGGPSLTTRSAGTKLVLYPAISGSTVDYAIGIDSATMWSSVAENSNSFNFKWFGGDIVVANLSGTGNFTTVGDIAVNGGDLTTTAATFNLINTDATTVNFAGAATTLIVGATSGVANIRNATTNIIGNATVGGTLNVTGQSTLGLVSATAINNTPIGNATPSTGAFTTLTANGVTTVTNTTDAPNQGTGAFVVSGGASVAGNLWVGGNINITGSSYVLTSNAGVFYGDAEGFGALYAGVAGYTPLPQTVIQTSASYNGYSQNNFENLSTGVKASTDWVATSGNGTDLNHYINMGITSPNWDGTQDNSLTTALTGNDGYLYVQGNAASGGNLVIGTSTLNRTVSVIVGGNTASNVTAVYRTPGTVSSSTTTGAFTVAGGIGLTGNLWIGGGTIATNTTAVDVFNTTASTVNAFGAATTLTLGDTTGTASIRNANIWVQNATTIDGASATVDLLNNATTVNAFDSATTANIGAGTGTFKINNPTVVGQQPTQNLYNTVATTMNFAGAATTLNLGASTGTATINNATINLEGNVNINKTTPSTNSTSGALVVDGGVGIAGNLNVGQNVVITGNLTVNGDVTTVNTATLDVEDLNITIAKGAASSAAADGAGLTVDGASATILYTHATTSWDLNKITRITDSTDTTNETSGALRVAGGVAIAKDLFVGGGDIITDETTFNLLNTTATTLNVGGAATSLNLGATSGTLTINNPTVVGTQSTQAVFNTTATTVNAFGAATTLIVGATTGIANIRNATTNVLGNATVGGTLAVTGDTTITGDLAVNGGDLTTTASTFNLLNANATTVDAFKAATDLEFGATSGTLTINNPTVVGTQATQALYNTTATTLNFAGAATSLVVGATSGTLNLRNANIYMPNATTLFSGQTTVSLLNENVTTLNAAGAATTLTLGATSGTASLRNANIWLPNATTIDGAQTTVGLLNNATTVNAFDSATYVNIGANSGNVTINNPSLIGTSATQGLFNTAATTTLNIGSAATTVTLGFSSGTANIRNANIYFPNATTIYSGQATLSIANEVPTTLSIGGAATTLTLGATSGTVNLRNANLYLPNASTVFSGQTTVAFMNNVPTTVTAWDAATALTLGDATGYTRIDSGNIYLPNAANIASTQGTVAVFNTDTTTINAFGAATSVVAGATSGTFNIRNANLYLPNATTIFSGQTSLSLANTVATTVNAFGAATTLNFASGTGSTTIRNSTTSLGILYANSATTSTNTTTGGLVVAGGVGVGGNLHVAGGANVLRANVTSTVSSTAFNNGALTVAGGAGVAGNINVKLGQQITVGIEDPRANVAFPDRQLVLIANANVASGINVRNVNSGPAASSNYFAVADNNVGESHFIATGIASSEFNSGGGVINANDSYVTNRGGNLVIAADPNGDLIFATGGSTPVLKYSWTTANISIPGTVISTSTTTGALTVGGGVGIGGNIWVANGAVINDSQSSDNFTVKGKLTSSLIYADSNQGAVVIGGSNAAPQLGATLKINSTDSVLLPVGATADRPGNSGNVDVAGMIRFNTSLNTVEYYTGSTWAASGSDTTFTIITSQTFNGNGLANTYVLTSNTTTNGTVVSINGILQIPTLAYSITGNTLVFTENPADGDLIDVRTLATTQTVGDVTSADGLNTFTPDNIYGAAIYSGTTTGNKAIRATAKPDGTWAYINGTKTTYDQTATATSTTITVIDSFPASDYTSAKYIVQTKNGSDIESMEALVVTTGTDAYITTFGIIASNVSLGSLTANVVSGNVRLYYNTALTNSNVKVYTTYIV